METFEARVTPIEHNHNMSEGKKAKKRLDVIVEGILALIVIAAAVFIFYKYYLNSEELDTIDKMITYSVFSLRENVKADNFNKEFQIVKFPDKTGIVSSNGKIMNNVNLDLEEFEDGYILMYKNGKYEFQVQYHGYCMEKDLEDDKYTMSIFKKCTKEKVSTIDE